LFRPIVTPLLAQDDGDIPDMPQADPFRVGPVGPAAAGLLQGHPAPAIRLFRQRGDEALQGLPGFDASGPRNGEYSDISPLPDQLAVRLEGKGCSRHRHHHLRPREASCQTRLTEDFP
jgi:hypothetical protein